MPIYINSKPYDLSSLQDVTTLLEENPSYRIYIYNLAIKDIENFKLLLLPSSQNQYYNSSNYPHVSHNLLKLMKLFPEQAPAIFKSAFDLQAFLQKLTLEDLSALSNELPQYLQFIYTKTLEDDAFFTRSVSNLRQLQYAVNIFRKHKEALYKKTIGSENFGKYFQDANHLCYVIESVLITFPEHRDEIYLLTLANKKQLIECLLTITPYSTGISSTLIKLVGLFPTHDAEIINTAFESEDFVKALNMYDLQSLCLNIEKFRDFIYSKTLATKDFFEKISTFGAIDLACTLYAEHKESIFRETLGKSIARYFPDADPTEALKAITLFPTHSQYFFDEIIKKPDIFAKFLLNQSRFYSIPNRIDQLVILCPTQAELIISQALDNEEFISRMTLMEISHILVSFPAFRKLIYKKTLGRNDIFTRLVNSSSNVEKAIELYPEYENEIYNLTLGTKDMVSYLTNPQDVKPTIALVKTRKENTHAIWQAITKSEILEKLLFSSTYGATARSNLESLMEIFPDKQTLLMELALNENRFVDSLFIFDILSLQIKINSCNNLEATQLANNVLYLKTLGMPSIFIKKITNESSLAQAAAAFPHFISTSDSLPVAYNKVVKAWEERCISQSRLDYSRALLGLAQNEILNLLPTDMLKEIAEYLYPFPEKEREVERKRFAKNVCGFFMQFQQQRRNEAKESQTQELPKIDQEKNLTTNKNNKRFDDSGCRLM